MDKEIPLYITTTLPYVNSDPHIGFALEAIQADLYARFARIEGREVFFNIGTDEHGQKIFQKATEEGKDVQDYVDYYAGEFLKLQPLLNLSFDAFIRTTDVKHIAAAQEMWKRCEANGDIFKKQFKGMYCVGCEAFLSPSDLIDNKCPDHAKALVEVEEENYFFKLSNYQSQIEEYLNSDVIIPENQKKQALSFVKSGLEDVSISRLKEKMSWGIPVPGDEGHVMYVWFEALINYISTLGWPDSSGNFSKYWLEGERMQVGGKDQVRFQSILWQAMLMSAGIPTTDTVFYHGFIISDGQKMSKSIGNVIHPLKIVEEFGTDVMRYVMLRHVHPTEDSDITLARVLELYNAHLVNGLGNLTSRILTMYESYNVEVALNDREKIWRDPEFDDFKQLIRGFKFNEALDYIWQGVGGLDSFIATEEPYKRFKTDPEKAQSDVAYAYIRLFEIATLIEPFMPETSEKMVSLIKVGKKPSEPLFERK